ncbi:MAG: hypothetical protein K0R28_4966 [Paenibacillus sp.]|jgi:2-keto-3-deoxy-L-rhamnonate aldolase RhmA|nr:hypothetical protein [Paenibacillus sp.]
MKEARNKVAEAALRAGKFAGTIGKPEAVPELTSKGYRFISIGADSVT